MFYLLLKIVVGIISLVSFLYFTFVLFSHYTEVKKVGLDKAEDQQAIKNFFSTLDILAKYFIRQAVKRYNFILHYILFVVLQFFTLIKVATNYVYNKTRKYFIKKSIEDQSHLVYFWDYLKKYKKEIDKEKDTSHK